MNHPSLSDRLARARTLLGSVGQEHVLRFSDRLDEAALRGLLDQVDSVDWPEVARLVGTHVLSKPVFALPADVRPAPWYPNRPAAGQQARYAQAWERGVALVRAGQVAAFTVAGGQGTRLGWDRPKGTFPATPVRGQSLFGCMAEYIQKAREKWGALIPWYIMTSPINDADTRAYFAEHDHFGLGAEHVFIFPQAMMPAIDMAGGKVLLEAPHALALSPNGHGGSLKALWTSGAIADMQRRGIQHLCYTQVDNPIVRIIDPLFLGLHDLDDCQMSSKMLPKREPLEKLGNFCIADGKMTVIEYSDLPDALAHERLPDGQLRFLAGSIAIHLLRVDFVARLNASGGDGRAGSAGFALPFHRAEKKVPHIDLATGAVIKPSQPNAVKLETFVFDALPLCQRTIIYETDRADEFAPIKNADAPAPAPGKGPEGVPPVNDSPATSKAIQVARAARWLEAQGVRVPRRADGSPDAVLEISHATAIYADDLKGVKLPKAIQPGARVLL